jgi:hypothetical protein
VRIEMKRIQHVGTIDRDRQHTIVAVDANVAERIGKIAHPTILLLLSIQTPGSMKTIRSRCLPVHPMKAMPFIANRNVI